MTGPATWRNTTGLSDGFLSIDKAVHTAITIAEKPVNITVVRSGASQSSAQPVRLEAMATPTQQSGEQFRGGEVDMLVTGYKDHPTIDDTDLRKGDRFKYNDQWYEVVEIYPEIEGRLMAVARSSSRGVT
jgi:hypothetical protein